MSNEINNRIELFQVEELKQVIATLKNNLYLSYKTLSLESIPPFIKKNNEQKFLDAIYSMGTKIIETYEKDIEKIKESNEGDDDTSRKPFTTPKEFERIKSYGIEASTKHPVTRSGIQKLEAFHDDPDISEQLLLILKEYLDPSLVLPSGFRVSNFIDIFISDLNIYKNRDSRRIGETIKQLYVNKYSNTLPNEDIAQVVKEDSDALNRNFLLKTQQFFRALSNGSTNDVLSNIIIAYGTAISNTYMDLAFPPEDS